MNNKTNSRNCQPRPVVNGFITAYTGTPYPASSSNEISYEGFCLMGGLENSKLQKVDRGKGRFTYHRVDR